MTEGEEELRKTLRSQSLGGSVRSYLPQTWVFTTEQESLTVHADNEGRIWVSDGLAPVRDGAVAIRHDLLAESIRTGEAPPPGSLVVNFYTDKGRAAFEHLASFFGF